MFNFNLGSTKAQIAWPQLTWSAPVNYGITIINQQDEDISNIKMINLFLGVAYYFAHQYNKWASQGLSKHDLYIFMFSKPWGKPSSNSREVKLVFQKKWWKIM